MEQPPVMSGAARWCLMLLGLLLAALGALGALLPILPTTPFVLLAAACFARSSPVLHRRLLANRAIGPYLVQWQSDRTVPRAAKWKAYTVVVATFALSIVLVDLTWARATLAAVGIALITVLARLPTTLPTTEADDGAGQDLS